MRIFLSGPMGVGKSTVARALARRLGLTALDLDARIVERAGRPVAEIFEQEGEAGFRARERQELARVLAEPDGQVVALGGGTAADEATRRLLLGRGVLITLDAPVAELLQRVGQGGGRPLLSGRDPRAGLEAVLRVRAAAYAECHARVDTADRDPERVAEAVAEVATDPPVVVPLGERSYAVEVGAGVRARAGARVREHASGGLAVVVTDAGAARWAAEAGASIEGAGRELARVALEAGEEHKTVAAVERIWDAALEAGLDRDGIVVGVGGGVAGDLAGFAASTLLRGVALGQVPTTLLAMVDSSVGGKTGFNRPQGKNLVGTFHQPRFVLCDVETLSTLPEAERRAGLAEVVKSAWLEGEAAVAMLERDAEALLAGDEAATTRAIRMAVGLKARIVTEDEREAGRRMLLNLGHTVGHALEAAGGYRRLRHGEAVALGMVAAFRVGMGLGAARPEQAERLAALLRRLGLPWELDVHLDPHALTFVGTDKKRRGGKVRFVVPAEPGETRVLPLERDRLTRWVAP